MQAERAHDGAVRSLADEVARYAKPRRGAEGDGVIGRVVLEVELDHASPEFMFDTAPRVPFQERSAA